MKLLLDTNRYSDFRRGVPDVVATLEGADQIFVPFVVLAELRAGFVRGTRAELNEKRLATFMARPGVEPLYADDQTTHQYADVRKKLQDKGRLIPIHDMWIAALAIQHRLPLYARDKHFNDLPQIVIVLPGDQHRG